MVPELIDGQNLWQVKWTGGGRVPDELIGRWTHRSLCQAQIDHYNITNTVTTENKKRGRPNSQ